MTRARLLAVAMASLLVGAAFSWLKLRFHCRIPDSEACVWGKAFFDFTLPLETLVVGGVLFAVIIGLQRLRRRRGA